MKKTLLIASTIGFLSASSIAQAVTAYAYSGPTAGTQNFNGPLGLDFDVITPITITDLLAFDDDADGWASAQVQVGIFDRNSGTLISQSVTFSSSNVGILSGGSYRSLSITSLNLNAGQYSIVAQGFNGDDLLNNSNGGATSPTTDSGGGLISFVGGARFGFESTLAYPTNPDGGPANKYGAGSFSFQPVPEPTIISSALLGLGLLFRRKRNS
jgi:hypothetical protein